MKNLLIIALVALGASSSFATDKKDEKKKDSYPLDTCVVSGEKLEGMGKSHSIKYKGQEVRFCCKPCEKDFNKEPEKYLQKIKDAQKAGKKS